MKKLALILVLLSSSVYASNDLEKWNSEASKNIRKEHSQQLAKTTYRELSSKVANVSDDLKTVRVQIESKATVQGAKTRVVAEAFLEPERSKFYKYGSKILRGANIIGTAFLLKELLMQGLDYIMEDGGKITKPDINNPTSNNYVWIWGGTNIYDHNSYLNYASSSPQGACSLTAGLYYSYVSLELTSPTTGVCHYVDKVNPKVTKTYTIQLLKNPYYDVNAKAVVTDQTIQDDIKNLFEDPTKKELAKEILKNAYSFDYINSDNAEIAKDFIDKQQDILKSDNPVSSNESITTPQVDNANSGKSDSTSTGQSSTTQETIINPDGSTTNIYNTTNSTTNSSTFELPAFCGWASIVCEWIGWTQEDETSSDTKIKFEEDDEEEEKPKTDIEIKGSCPAPEKIHIGSIFNFNMEISYDPACELAQKTKPVLIAVGFFIYILIVGGIKGSD